MTVKDFRYSGCFPNICVLALAAGAWLIVRRAALGGGCRDARQREETP